MLIDKFRRNPQESGIFFGWLNMKVAHIHLCPPILLHVSGLDTVVSHCLILFHPEWQIFGAHFDIPPFPTLQSMCLPLMLSLPPLVS